MSSDSWRPEDFRDKVSIRPPRVRMPKSRFNAASLTQDEITDDRLQAAYQKVAEIISAQGKDGEAYLPIFARLHEEIQSREANKSLLCLARDVAAKKPEA